jgi:5-formyltetrahydrofolate cyclo-ligase
VTDPPTTSQTGPQTGPQTGRQARPGGRDVQAAKARLRTRSLAARGAMSGPERAEAAALVCHRLLALPELQTARVVLGYAAFGTECDVDPVLDTLIGRGAGVLLPWVDGDDLRIARVRDLSAGVAPGWRGVREPRPEGRRPARPDRVEVALVPGVAFDRSGARLGYGGGHFDRLLARLAAAAAVIGVAYGTQVLDSLPSEPHDRRVDILVTEREVLRIDA